MRNQISNDKTDRRNNDRRTAAASDYLGAERRKRDRRDAKVEQPET